MKRVVSLSVAFADSTTGPRASSARAPVRTALDAIETRVQRSTVTPATSVTTASR